MRIHEVPVDWTDDADSRVHIVSTALEDLRGITRLARTRYVLVDGGNSGGPAGASSTVRTVMSWVAAHGTTVSTGSSSRGTLYDLSGAVTTA